MCGLAGMCVHGVCGCGLAGLGVDGWWVWTGVVNYLVLVLDNRKMRMT